MNRRQFLARGGAAVAATGVVGFGAWKFELHHVQVVERVLPIAALPASLDGARLVQVSDLHVGPLVDDGYVQRALKIANSLNPDILAFTGDFVTWEGAQQLTQLDRVLSVLKPAKLATVTVLGNHDYGWQWRMADVSDSVADVVSRHGVQVIRNDVCVVEGLNIVGIDDLWAHREDVALARSKVAPGAPTLVLAHNPDVADLPVWSGYRGWMLSGHTHGGQCRLPFCAPPILPVANKRYAAGEVALADGRTIYINRGIGHTLPIRVLVRPEITSFRLARA